MISLLALTFSASAAPGDLADHDLDKVWVYYGNGSCGANSGGWVKQRLFPGVSSGPLSKYCRMIYTGNTVPTPDPGLPDPARMDRLALAPMSGTPASLEANTLSRTAPIHSLPTLNHPPARVALLDSIPDGDLDYAYYAGSSEFSDHGNRLAVLNRRLVCSSNPNACAAEQKAYLALGWKVVNDEPIHDFSGGGAIGSQSDLARRIYDAVSDWEADRDVDGGTTVGPLVLNLSLGWHPDMGGTGAPTSFDPPVKSVFHALSYAACKGALVVSAAGNLAGADDVEQPLYPAAWERFNVPTPKQCKTLTGEATTNLAGSATYARLLYGVGGVTPDRQPMGITRPGSLPTHVAAGTHLAVTDSAQGALIQPMSGTSVSTAVVSASAAVVRSYRPDLKPAETMELLRDGAIKYNWTTSSAPDWPTGSGFSDLHVISVCNSLREACAGNATCTVSHNQCPTSPTLVPVITTPPAGVAQDWSLDASSSTCASDPNNDVYAIVDSTPYLPVNDLGTCPVDEAVSVTARPMTLPMPPIDPCEPFCDVDFTLVDPTIYIPVGITDDMSDVSLTVKTKQGSITTAEIGKMIGNTTYILEADNGDLLPNGETPSSAYLTYIFEGKTTVYGEEVLFKY